MFVSFLSTERGGEKRHIHLIFTINVFANNSVEENN